jgi:NAD(P)-dependent dehydrogenase (short-subunit alcohol dehydrogenase family)
LPEQRERNGGRLDGKVAVITGATKGIDWRAAEIFVAEGARIVIAARRAPEDEALAKELAAARRPQLYHAVTQLCRLAQGVRSGCGLNPRMPGGATASDGG